MTGASGFFPGTFVEFVRRYETRTNRPPPRPAQRPTPKERTSLSKVARFKDGQNNDDSGYIGSPGRKSDFLQPPPPQ